MRESKKHKAEKTKSHEDISAQELDNQIRIIKKAIKYYKKKLPSKLLSSDQIRLQSFLETMVNLTGQGNDNYEPIDSRAWNIVAKILSKKTNDKLETDALRTIGNAVTHRELLPQVLSVQNSSIIKDKLIDVISNSANETKLIEALWVVDNMLNYQTGCDILLYDGDKGLKASSEIKDAIKENIKAKNFVEKQEINKYASKINKKLKEYDHTDNIAHIRKRSEENPQLMRMNEERTKLTQEKINKFHQTILSQEDNTHQETQRYF